MADNPANPTEQIPMEMINSVKVAPRWANRWERLAEAPGDTGLPVLTVFMAAKYRSLHAPVRKPDTGFALQ
jgi:hypothetical protein